jgi:hypothetical protein
MMNLHATLEQSQRWTLAAAVHLLLLVPLFALWAPWTGAIPTARAAELYPGTVDLNWHAVQVNHGIATEWRWGTIPQNPLGFAACSGVLAFSLAGFFYCLHRAK